MGSDFLMLVVVMAVALSGCGSQPEAKKDAGASKPAPAKKPVELKLGLKKPDNHIESIAIKKFAELVEQKTKGEVKIIPYFGESLGDSKTQLENLVQGVQDFYADSYTFYEKYSPAFRIHSLPYVFRDNEHYAKFLKSDAQAQMEKELLDKAGIRIINIDRNWPRGPYRVIASKKPIQKLEDLKGLKLRLPDSQAQFKTWQVLGPSISTMPWSECYLALKQGTIEAITAPIGDIHQEKFYEVVSHLTITHEYPQQIAIAMNNKKFMSLTKEQQQALYEAAKEAGELCTKLLNENTQLYVNELKNKYNVKIYEVDLEPWRQKVSEVHKQLEKEGFIPAGLIDKAKAIK